MEFRVLKYFLAVAQEENISAAAERLHVTQPTLSRQLKDLEDELGKTLFIRGSRRISLTEEGMILRKRAEEITALVQKTEDEITISDEYISGDIYIGAGETDAMCLIARVMKKVQQQYPDIHFHIVSGNTTDLIDRFENGLLDFCILFTEINELKYDSLKIPVFDTWGVLMNKESELAGKKYIMPEDLWDKPLIMSQQYDKDTPTSRWLKKDVSSLNVVATYNLVYNASRMAAEGLGYVLCFDKLVNVTGDSNLCFVPLKPTVQASMCIAWKKYQTFTKAAKKFIEALQEELENSVE